jgi:flagellar biogenesis protein FliO
VITRLVVVTVALAMVAVALRYRSGKSTKRSPQLRVTARTALHRGAFLAVVEIEGRRLLIGASQHVQLLTELEPVTEGPERHRPERPSELPTVPDDALSIIERARRATSRTLDPAARARARHPKDSVT